MLIWINILNFRFCGWRKGSNSILISHLRRSRRTVMAQLNSTPSVVSSSGVTLDWSPLSPHQSAFILFRRSLLATDTRDRPRVAVLRERTRVYRRRHDHATLYRGYPDPRFSVRPIKRTWRIVAYRYVETVGRSCQMNDFAPIGFGRCGVNELCDSRERGKRQREAVKLFSRVGRFIFNSSYAVHLPGALS